MRNDSGCYRRFEIVHKLVRNFENCKFTDVIADEIWDMLHLGVELLVMQ